MKKKKENIRKTFSDRLLGPFIFNVSGTGQKLPEDRENDRNFAGQRCQMYLYRRYKNTGQSHLHFLYRYRARYRSEIVTE